jgi:uncharacterized protein YjbJ (UPF0337 family)
MADNFDRPDDSNAPRHTPDSVAEETSATGQRFKGKIKEEVGDAMDDEQMEEKGRREKQAGIDRQRKNDGA